MHVVMVIIRITKMLFVPNVKKNIAQSVKHRNIIVLNVHMGEKIPPIVYV